MVAKLPLSCPGKDFPQENINPASQIAFSLATRFKDWRRKSILSRVTGRKSPGSKPPLLSHPIPCSPPLPGEDSTGGAKDKGPQRKAKVRHLSQGPARASEAPSAPIVPALSAAPSERGARDPRETPFPGHLTF